MLLLVAFLTGAAVMAFEVLGFRVMAITFGGLDVVNGSLIGAVLTALSAGYYLGGMIADRYPRPVLLGLFIIASGVAIAVVPELSRVIYDSNISNPLKTGMWGPLAGALIMFAPPSILLGITSPFVIRVMAPRPEVLGRVAGRVYALSTVGSIFGTLITTFYLMPAEWLGGHNNALRLVGGVSIMTGLIPILWGMTARRTRAAGALAVALIALAGPVLADLKYKRDTSYHHIEVHEETYGNRRLRLLRFDNSEQSGLDLDNPDNPVWMYTEYMHLAWVFQPNPQRALVLGLGGAVIPNRMRRDYRDLTIDIAELDPVVQDVARRYFMFREDPKMKVFISDGRQYLRRTENKYDLIVMDAYHGGRYGPTLPFTLCTREFFEIVNSKLSNDGVLAFNLIGQLEGSSQLTRSIIKTMQDVFPNVYIFPVELKRTAGLALKRNIIVICTKDAKRVSASTIVSRARKLVSDRAVTIADYVEYAEDLYEGALDMRSVRILTDATAQPDRLLQP
jgi:spermidine synthase